MSKRSRSAGPLATGPTGFVREPFFLAMGPLSQSGVRSIVQHKYMSGEWSIGDQLMNRFWEWFASQLPLTLAPNLITLVGTIIQLSTLVAGKFYLQGSLQWSYCTLQLYQAACLFAYQTLDAVDGKQARRTASSSPLGQLFDHGCDALVTNVFIINLMTTLGLDPSAGLGFAAYAGSLTAFYLAQWEEASTHALRTSVNGIGVTEAQLSAMAVHISAAFLPRSMFEIPLVHMHVPSGPFLVGGLELDLSAATLIGVAIVGSAILTGVAFLYNVAVSHGRPDALFTLLPTSLLLTTSLCWHAVEQQELGPSAMHLAYALAQTHLTTQTIVYSMAREAVPSVLAQVSVLGYVLVAAVSWTLKGSQPELTQGLQWFLAAAIIIVYFHFAMAASTQIKESLGIQVFSISPQHRPAQDTSTKRSLHVGSDDANVSSRGRIRRTRQTTSQSSRERIT